MKFKQSIKIGNNVTDVMKVSCVHSCCKYVYSDDSVRFLYSLFPLMMAVDSKFKVANVGDWLCQDEDNLWHLLTADEYERNQ